MYKIASSYVDKVDFAFYLIFGVSLFFLVALTAVMIYFVIRYSRKRHPIPVQNDGSMTLEIIWTTIPLVIVLVLFYYGYVAFAPMRQVPEGSLSIKATGYMWDWAFEYPNGKEAKELVVPIQQPIVLKLYSRDVIHSLYIPAYRIKEDMVPGKENFMWFFPDKEGEYDIFCAEYCGLRHSYMKTKVKAMSLENYQAWLDSLPDKPKRNEHPGFKLLQKNACIGCHSLDGTKLVGPSFKGLMSSKKTVIDANGKELEITIDEIYLKESIIEPDKRLVKGYAKGLMRSYKDVINEEELNQIVEYFKMPEE